MNYEMSVLHQEIRYARTLADREQADYSNAAAILGGSSDSMLAWAISFHNEMQYSTSTIFVNSDISFCNISYKIALYPLSRYHRCCESRITDYCQATVPDRPLAPPLGY